ncbi:fidgetin-like protein 1 [Frankliniella occidentalis]|uniref:Fidgetin-like protein 1 n=1 Tax=Frankliniella occidentalis TaxID=133901 RepID=A0A9C6TYX3_FRAOC|nr:fidgetin-like protein 1 [Frankliniella occidentalis]
MEYTKGALDTKMATILIATLADLTGSDRVSWDDVCGLEEIKDTIEIDVVMPWANPARFTGLRSASRGILMYGPPGTGKTMIGKCIASQMKAKFFSVTASSLITKWAGEAERAVKTLFQLARALQPTIIFIDEIDALLGVRNDNEKHTAVSIIGYIFVIISTSLQDGCTTKTSDKVLFIGATNLPKSIDSAFIRRFTTRLYVPLPQVADRKVMLTKIMSSTENSLSEEDVEKIARETEGYSGSDLNQLCRWASKNYTRKLKRDSRGRFVFPENVSPPNLNF